MSSSMSSKWRWGRRYSTWGWRWGRRSRRSNLRLSSNNNNLYLPEELLEEILSWLPVKSLFRFRCVQKSWSTLFRNPIFIAKHLLHHQTKTENSSILVESYGLLEHVFSLHPYLDDDAPRIVDFSKDLGMTVLRRPIYINLFGCINGIICIGSPLAPYLTFGGGRSDVFALWNAAIREHKIIRCPPLPQRPFLPPYNVTTLFAFGYDQYSNDYKAVRIVTYNKNSPPTQNSLFTDVYSLNADSWTQVIDTTIHRSNVRLLSYRAMYFNGVNHWLGFFDNGHINELGQNCDCEIILSFDMSREVFRIMRLPDEVFRKLRYPVDSVSSTQRNKVFSVFNDCLAFVVYEEDTMTEKYFDIWVMRQYGVEDSWTKQLVVGPLLGIHKPLQFSQNGMLLLVGDDGTIVLYNIGSKEIRNLQIPEFLKSFIRKEATVYVESLVSLKGARAPNYLYQK
ncbi:F-box/kelch-repeat protein At3g06240 [Quercus suber]|uniref:F-box/kelch-repeat protein At3g06240 n=1 Tax=Quercus suber TaxID=58331 RepID=UPI0032DF4A72